MIPSNANFDAMNAGVARKINYLVEIAGYPKKFSFRKDADPTHYPWIQESSGIGNLSQQANVLDGTSSLSTCDLTLLDKDGQLLASFPSFTFRGKQITVKAGFEGLAESDYLTLATLVIDRVDSTENTTCFSFECSDYSRLVSNTVYDIGDDGQAVSSDHLRTVSGNPMDILLDVLRNELGLPDARINLTRLNAYRNGLLAGLRMQFQLDSAPEAQQFLDQEIFKALGGYAFENYAGQYTPFFLIPSAATTVGISLTDRNIQEPLPTPTLPEIQNLISYGYDFRNGSDFARRLVIEDAVSRATYGLSNLQTIESHGMKSWLGASIYIRLLANALFLRYGYEAPTMEVVVNWDACLLELGDWVSITHPLLPNRVLGTRGLTNSVWEVIGREYEWHAGLVHLNLLNIDWLAAAPIYQFAPDAIPSWPTASPAQRAQYMFVASATTGEYSDGTPGHLIP